MHAAAATAARSRYDRPMAGLSRFRSIRYGAALAVLSLCVLTLGGCDEDYGPDSEYDAASEGYEPAYYDGYVVYYDGVGRPYYYDRGTTVWISPGSAYYPGLIHHYHVYGGYYGGWYAHSGYRYRGYRYAPGHYAYHGYSHGPSRGGRRHR